MRFLNGFTWGGTGFVFLDAAHVVDVPFSAIAAVLVAGLQLLNTYLLTKRKNEK